MTHFAHRILGALCLSVALWLLSVRPVAACTPVPTAWFSEKFTAAPGSLPPEVSLDSVAVSNYFSGRRFLKIANGSASPLYLLGAAGQVTTVEELPIALPKGMEVQRKLAPSQSLTFGFPFGSALPPGVHPITSLLPSLEDRNTVSGFDWRPLFPRVPDEQQATLTLVYGDRLLTALVTLTYTLNPDYRPPTGCLSQTLMALLVPGALAVLVLVVGSIVVIRKVWPAAKKH